MVIFFSSGRLTSCFFFKLTFLFVGLTMTSGISPLGNKASLKKSIIVDGSESFSIESSSSNFFAISSAFFLLMDC